MILRQTLNFAAHFVAGVAIGMLAVSAMNKKKQAEDRNQNGKGAPRERPAGGGQ